jgi:uncharacterized membrane-anchored protein
MTKFLGRTRPAIVAVATLQTLALGYILYDRLTLLRYGREIVAEVIPVDPRDIFRGDYVILGYAFTRTGEVSVPDGTVVGDKLYVTMQQTSPENWEVTSVTTAYPDSTPPEHVVIRGFATYVYPKTETAPAKASLRYGIESYFVPEGTGLALEEQVRDKKISAVLAVGSSGAVAIKALTVDGKRIAEEPLL